MAKQPPEPVTPDGGPILSPDDDGAQAPTVVGATVEDAALHGHDAAPTHDADGHELDADGQPIIPDPPVVPTDASGDPSGQPDNEALDAEVDDVEAVPEVLAYCHNPECVINAVQVWKPLDEAPVMCQCGQLMQPDPIDAGEPVLVEDAPPA